MLEQTKWIIVASRTKTKIFLHDELTTQLSCLHVIVNPEGRTHSRMFGQDRLGARRPRHNSKNTTVGAGKDPHEHDAEKYAAQIAEVIAQSHLEKKFEKAVVFAEPHFMGLLKLNLNPKIASAIEWINKDLAKHSTPELERQLSL
jgi:protein required for attachment to host cells